MDTMIQSYMEETENMLQKAEECIIRLEMEYSSDDINELFRIAHTIKGSSHMIGYEDIGNLMHKIEDMLDLVRNGSIEFNRDIVSLCFDSLDIVKKMLQTKAKDYEEEYEKEHLEETSSVSSKIQTLISANKIKNKNSKVITATNGEKSGIVSSLLNKGFKGKNKYYVTIVIEEDAPMIAPVFTLVLKSIENIGSLLYSNITDDNLLGTYDNEVKVLEIILCTDIDEAELYTHFALFYVERINIINLNRNINEVNDYYLNETDYTPYLIILKTIMKFYRLAYCDEVITDIKRLQNETIEALLSLRNKVKSKAYGKEFTDLFNLTRKMHNAKPGSSQKIKSIIQERIKDFIEKMYYSIKGRYVVRYVKLEQNNVINGLRNFIEMINKSSTLIILIDLCNLDILHEDEIREIIRLQNELKNKGMEIGLIACGPKVRRIVNIFDSIRQVCEFKIYSTELDAIFSIFKSLDSYQRIINRINQICNETKGCEQ